MYSSYRADAFSRGTFGRPINPNPISVLLGSKSSLTFQLPLGLKTLKTLGGAQESKLLETYPGIFWARHLLFLLTDQRDWVCGPWIGTIAIVKPQADKAVGINLCI